MMMSLGIMHLPGGWEWIVILVVALLIFGKRLPDVGRSIGKTLVEFKKGMKGLDSELADVNHQIEKAASSDDKPQQLT